MEYLSRAVAVIAKIWHTGGFIIKITNESYVHYLCLGNILLCQILRTTTAFQTVGVFFCLKTAAIPSLCACNFLIPEPDVEKTTNLREYHVSFTAMIFLQRFWRPHAEARGGRRRRGGVPGTLARERVLRGGEGGREAAASPHVGLREVGISGWVTHRYGVRSAQSQWFWWQEVTYTCFSVEGP